MRHLKLLMSIRAWTVLALLLGVLPIGLTSTEMWDGVIGVHAMAQNDWVAMKGWGLDSNWYLPFGLLALLDGLHHQFGLPIWLSVKVWLLLMILGIAHETDCLAQKVFDIPATATVWARPLIFSFPIWYVFFSYMAMLGHLTCVWLALVGYRKLHERGGRQLMIGAVLMTLSFQLASNCVFLLALEAGRWVLRREKAHWSYTRSALLLTLAVAVFTATRVIWPPVGSYAGYNQLLNPLRLSSWLSYVKYGAFFATWLLLLLPMAIGWAKTGSRQSTTQFAGGKFENLKWLAFFAFLMLAACAAYIGVGLSSPLFILRGISTSASSISATLASEASSWLISVWYGGWGARHLLLMMLPITVLTCWLANRQSIEVNASLSANAKFALVASIALNLALGVPGHWAKLKRIANEHTLVAALKRLPEPPPGQVELLMDPPADYVSSVHETNYLLYQAYKKTQWAGVMVPRIQPAQAWGDEQVRFLRDKPPVDRSLAARVSLMNDYDWDKRCKTTARVSYPALSLWDVLWRAEHAVDELPNAVISQSLSNCPKANGFWF